MPEPNWGLLTGHIELWGGTALLHMQRKDASWIIDVDSKEFQKVIIPQDAGNPVGQTGALNFHRRTVPHDIVRVVLKQIQLECVKSREQYVVAEAR